CARGTGTVYFDYW
nr:immunoglobulin heavy chain junction region [Mus musculus]NSM03689.1 immunoglobulin heavy chain junction region [Mus musculus]NSM03698.1 immunoglobulin heavy chain junction region [Mus musculus]NSM03722.1 immunoglobulin heavy chain junction region [Mus musculus]NSM03732.1 immunoglobulin heavy chain junction region [Mus musculus]